MGIINYILEEQTRLAEEKKQIVLQQEKEAEEKVYAMGVLKRVEEELKKIGVNFEGSAFWHNSIKIGKVWVEFREEDDVIWDNNLDKEKIWMICWAFNAEEVKGCEPYQFEKLFGKDLALILPLIHYVNDSLC